MRWFLIYYVIGLIFELAFLPMGWDKAKRGADDLMQDHDEEALSESKFTALTFLVLPFVALAWPIGALLKIFPKLVPADIRKYTGK